MRPMPGVLLAGVWRESMYRRDGREMERAPSPRRYAHARIYLRGTYWRYGCSLALEAAAHAHCNSSANTCCADAPGGARAAWRRGIPIYAEVGYPVAVQSSESRTTEYCDSHSVTIIIDIVSRTSGSAHCAEGLHGNSSALHCLSPAPGLAPRWDTCIHF